MKLANRIVALLTLALGIYSTVEGINLNFFTANNNPGPGFMPVCLGLLIIFLSTLILIRSFKNKEDEGELPITRMEARDLVLVTGGAVGMIVLVPLLGIVISIGIMAGVLSVVMGERRVPVIAALTILTPLFLYLLFGYALGVPLPMGIFV